MLMMYCGACTRAYASVSLTVDPFALGCAVAALAWQKEASQDYEVIE